jgi:hypothetical protein
MASFFEKGAQARDTISTESRGRETARLSVVLLIADLHSWPLRHHHYDDVIVLHHNDDVK